MHGGGDLADARGDILDGGADRLERLAGLLDGGDAVARCAAPSATTPTTLLGLGLDLADQRGDLAGGGLGLLGQLADLLGDDGEAAALLAGAGGLDGGVERQQVGLLGDAGDRVDDAADLLGLARRGPRSRVPTCAEESATWRIASVACAAALTPSRATLAGLLGGLGGGSRRCRRWRSAARAASWTASRVDSTMRTWRSAPWATSADGGGDLADRAAGLVGGRRPSAARRTRPCRRSADDLADQRAELRAHRRCRPRSSRWALPSISLKVSRQRPSSSVRA